MDGKDVYQIGELAARSGMTPDALRYYERLGLLAPPRRTTGGFRLYPAATLERLRFIKQAQMVGFTLHEIAALVAYQDHGGARRCRQVRDLLRSKLGDLDAKLRELGEFRQTLGGYLQECERALSDAERLNGAADAPCPVIEELRTKSR